MLLLLLPPPPCSIAISFSASPAAAAPPDPALPSPAVAAAAAATAVAAAAAMAPGVGPALPVRLTRVPPRRCSCCCGCLGAAAASMSSRFRCGSRAAALVSSCATTGQVGQNTPHRSGGREFKAFDLRPRSLEVMMPCSGTSCSTESACRLHTLIAACWAGSLHAA